MKLASLEVPDTLPQFAGQVIRTAQNILATQVPTGALGKLIDKISQFKYVRFVDLYGRMDARSAVALAFRFGRKQIAIRPRIKLVGLVLGGLALALISASKGADSIEAKRAEIKINGQAILVAEKNQPSDTDIQIDANVSYKESPFDFKMPVSGYTSQGYSNYHRAIDIATSAQGVPIVALGEGRIEFAGYTTDGKGNVVIVDHGDGLKSLYAHMARINVSVGNQVDTNTVVGTVGLTGRTTGAHLHLEIYDSGIAVDPSKILPEVSKPSGS